MRGRVSIFLILLLLPGLVGLSGGAPPAEAAAQVRPFSLPFNTPPSPATWFLGQPHGNTTGAYNNGKYWYAAGQGLHFGIDFPAPCGTPVVAMADGIVEYVDNFSFGIRPHNVVLSHPELGYTSLYGHLLSKSPLVRGQPIRRGDVLGQTGDPDLTCVSRPHLHLEIRSTDYRTAFNPATLIETDWPMLHTIGGFSSSLFAKDLNAPNRWQTIESQPDIQFGGRILNNFTDVVPLPSRYSPPPLTLPPYIAPPLPADWNVAQGAAPIFTPLTPAGCCSQHWWAPDGRSVRFWDGPDGERAAIRAVAPDGQPAAYELPGVANGAQYRALFSPDGQYAVIWSDRRVAVLRLADYQTWEISTGGTWPRFSPGSTRLLWQRVPADIVPGTTPPRTEIWIANPDGSDRRLIGTQQGGSVAWLDDDRILTSVREPGTNITALSVYTISTGEMRPLLRQANLRGLTIAPGGRLLMYYLSFQDDPAANGVYVLDTVTATGPVSRPFFGSWRWRDSTSIIYIPFQPGAPMRFVLYDVLTGEERAITGANTPPFRIANDDWSIAPDGRHIVFWSADDYRLWSVKLPE